MFTNKKPKQCDSKKILRHVVYEQEGNIKEINKNPIEHLEKIWKKIYYQELSSKNFLKLSGIFFKN